MTKRRLRKLTGDLTKGTHMSYQITLPKILVEALKWNYNQMVEVSLDGDQLVLKAIV